MSKGGYKSALNRDQKGEDSRQHGSDQSFHELSAHNQARLHAGNVHGDFHNTDVTNQYHYNTYLIHKRRTLGIDRRERISMIASLVGLIAQSDSMHTQLDEIAATSAGSLRIAKEIRSQLACCRDTLKDFKVHIKAPDLSPHRAALMPADELVTSFTNALLLFSEAQEALKPLITTRSDPSMWYDKQNELSNLLERLWAQDLIWKMLLDILDCPTEYQADNIGHELARRIKRLLDENAELKARIESIEQQLDQVRRSTTFAKGTPYSNSSHAQNEETVIVTRWAGLSELSLADASTMGVIGLPVTASELAGSSFYSGLTTIGSDPGFQPGNYKDQLHKVYDASSQHEVRQSVPKRNSKTRAYFIGMDILFLTMKHFTSYRVPLKKEELVELIELRNPHANEPFSKRRWQK